MTDPINLFLEWNKAATQNSPLQYPEAVCLSTVNARGEPEARFVALKEVSQAGFIFCTAFGSPKGLEVDANNSVALTFWWDHIERQVRIAGTATRISDKEADRYFSERRRDAQLIAWASAQSQPLSQLERLEAKLQEVEARFGGKEVPRPKNWGGYCVKPTRLEFQKIKTNRLHERTLFTCDANGWTKQLLQP